MFGTIRKHRTWLWLLIIGATIVSFVYFFTPTVGQPRPTGPDNLGEINGNKITRAEYISAAQEARLEYFFATGEFPGSGSDFDELPRTFQRLFLIEKLKEYEIRPDDAAVAQYGRHLLRRLAQGQDVPLDVFEQQVLARNRLTLQDFTRYLRHSVGIDQLISLVGLSGTLVTPEEARWLYVLDQQERATEAVFFSASDYLSQVPEPTEEAIQEFYAKSAEFDYTRPERIQIHYVRFDLSNHIARLEEEHATNLAQTVEANMEQLGTNYTLYGSTPDEARAKLRELMLRNEALPRAKDEAQAFANQVYQIEPVRAENLAAVAASNGLPVHTTPPFDRSSPPEGLKVGADFINRVFMLSTNEPLDGPLSGEDAVYVVALAQRLPSEVKPLEEVREQVVADYKQSEAAELARQAGRAFSQTVSNELAQGKSFAEVCEAAGVKPVTVPPFSRSTRQLEAVQERMMLPQYAQIAFSTPVGQASGFSATRDGGVIVYVKEDLPVDEAKLTAELPTFLRYLQQQRRQAAAELWFQREASAALGNIPALQRYMQPGPADS
ncbi:MAG TPA: hypothetical protein GYA07_12550 [Verrucomicrobia bacterium]|nr:hypothetical protein [Verrucomicrobiota bacterium]HOP97370.1 SurA N-terminal domain-containing protein [Verrucomicrobiota bacterium]HPU56333.1 SurA N-terminal domain-containing protein [Verrucomicrobiota bacterium]